jgi:glycosyltransferase involved in cell wall biosynthesis
MPSRLKDYPGSARNKDQKLLRAINSVLMQTFKDWELLIIADGCKETVMIVNKFIKDNRIALFEIEFKRLWSGNPRNKGIEEAKGEWITYLDIDDVFGEKHLEIINNQLGNYDWVWFDDFRYRQRLKYWYKNPCEVGKIGKCGTSNVTHKRSLGVMWPEKDRYAHDFHFIEGLLQFKNYAKIETPEYFVCHVPGIGGYDI